MFDILAQAQTAEMIPAIHKQVTQWLPERMTMLLVLAALAVVVGLFIAWGQRTLARNQVELARMLKDHAEAHHKN